MEKESTKRKFVPVAADYIPVGETPRSLAKKKRRKVLNWLLNFGTSSAKILNAVAPQKETGFANTLVAKGLLTATKTDSGFPRFFYTLTKNGLDEALAFSTQPIVYKCLEPHKISQTFLEHDHAVQWLCIDIGRKYGFQIISENRAKHQADKGQKVADAEWRTGDKVAAIEVEFSQKFGRVLDQTIYAIIDSIQREEFHAYFYFVRSKIIADNYRKAMSPGAQINRWEKDLFGRWVKNESIEVPPWLIEHMHFFEIDGEFKNPFLIQKPVPIIEGIEIDPDL